MAQTWHDLLFAHWPVPVSCEERADWIHYRSERTNGDALSAVLEARYRPAGTLFVPRRGTLEHFFTERYCLYATDGRGGILRDEIHHPPWSLQLAEAEFAKNTMKLAAGFSLPVAKPLLHFAKQQDVVVWRPEYLMS